MRILTLFFAIILISVPFAKAEEAVNLLDELDPADPNIEALLEEYDQWYEEGTGLPSHIGDGESLMAAPRCYRSTCRVWARVVKSQQMMYLYVNGVSHGVWPVSTGVRGHGTPNFDQHPGGRIYDRYTSRRYPGGDYRGLGNMPYAVFIRGGYAIHGTPEKNWPYLGKPASKGCIRLHPDHGYTFNRLVRTHGVRNVWITVH